MGNFFWWDGCNSSNLCKKRFYHDHYSAIMFLPLVIEVFDLWAHQIFLVKFDVLTWCGQQKALETVLYWSYECQWHYREHMLTPS